MLILSLKAQVNHFHHMDVEFRDEFRKIDKRFDKLTTILTWGLGLLVSSQVTKKKPLFRGAFDYRINNMSKNLGKGHFSSGIISSILLQRSAILTD
jgi:hypothetical protein